MPVSRPKRSRSRNIDAHITLQIQPESLTTGGTVMTTTTTIITIIMMTISTMSLNLQTVLSQSLPCYI